MFVEPRSGRRHDYRITIERDDPANRLILTLGRGGLLVTGAVTVEPLSSSGPLPDERAAILFEDAIDAFRDRDDGAGCRLLRSVVATSARNSVWAEKARRLHSRRCE
jgi:hypothetical protein